MNFIHQWQLTKTSILHQIDLTPKAKMTFFSAAGTDNPMKNQFHLENQSTLRDMSSTPIFHHQSPFLFLVATIEKDGLGSADLYVSRRASDLSWKPAVNFGSVLNSNKMDYCPFVDIKTKTLYFTSKRNSINPDKAFETANEFLLELTKYENGLSRLYKIGLETILHINE